MPDTLKPEQLYRPCEVERFEFETTAELEPDTRIIGQPRGSQAILFGIDIDSPGYNTYVQGEAGTGRATAIERFIGQRAIKEPVPPDWVYVHNFTEPHKPRAIRLQPGAGAKLREDLKRLIEDLGDGLPRAFDTEQYRSAAREIEHKLEAVRESSFGALQAKARELGAAVIATPTGLQIVPAKDGQPLPPQTVASMPQEAQQAWRETARALEGEAEDTLRQLRSQETKTQEAMRDLVRSVASGVVEQRMKALKQSYSDNEPVLGYLDEMQQDVLDNVGLFRPADKEAGGSSRELAALRLRRYSANVIIDHAREKGAPVVVEYSPTLPGLRGRVEHEPRPRGGTVTDFTLIRPGALHAANGGYLVLRARDLFAEPGAWEGLKRALVAGSVCPDDPATRVGAPTRSLNPEPIPLDLKVILLGPALVYYLLHESDEDFRTIFKVMADFDERMERTAENEMEYATFIATRCSEEGLHPLNREAAARIVEQGSRLAGSQTKLSTRFGDIADLIREASYWAGKAEREVVTKEDVEKAIEQHEFLHNRIESRLREQVMEGTLLIATQGEEVGQVNGLTVTAVGEHRFGHPSRVTARTFMGKEGVVQIDREVELAGPIHNKGVMTLVGYLGGHYAQDQPLSLSAQITFEQNYGGIEGDSASSTELFALLSSLSGMPIKQTVAVTGSVNQRGEIQAIGGVSEKAEGWFAVCKQRRLNGDQGVIMPAANVKDLMITAEVRQAVAEGKFHLWAIETVDEGLEILTGKAARKVHEAAMKRLRSLAEGLEAFGKKE
jgi:lon-related putative ATP-dependent protease